MELYSWTEHYKLYHWNMLDLLQVIEPNTISSIVTDPPYELNFMWKWWDNSWIAFNPDTWKKCLEVLKPWWYLLAFWGSRTYHRIACAIEDAGFEIRDCIMWLYGSWFPKSMNIWLAIDKKNWVESEVVWEWKSWSSATHTRTMTSETKDWKSVFGWEYQIKKASNEWNWWGTALKPSYEPIIVARKPLEWSCTDNVIKYWVGGINIDECRVKTDGEKLTRDLSVNNPSIKINNSINWQWSVNDIADKLGRFPANTILTYWDDDKEEVCWWFPYTKSTWGSWIASQINTFKNVRMWANWKNTWANLGWLWDEWSAARYFYCAKASKRDRDEGLDKEWEKVNDGRNTPIDNPFQRWET